MIPSLDHLRVVLVEPKNPGNIGSVCRAMKNFRASDLALVNPCDHLADEAKMFAVRGKDILEGATVVTSLRDALRDVHFSIGTTTRVRDTHFPTFLPKDVAERISRIDRASRIAIVFGREDNGLTTDELHQCDIVSTILADENYASLNIAQAAMIYLYEAYQMQVSGNPTFEWRLAKREELDVLYGRIRHLLETIEFPARTTLDDFIVGLKRLLGRTPIEDRDVRILHKMFQEIDFFMEKQKDKKKKSLNLPDGC
jgi:tRNA/rRNA methyltransferase